jgi:hypothetical protein
MSFFFICKIGKQEGRTGPAWEGGMIVAVGGARGGRVTTVQILLYVNPNEQRIPVQTIPGMGMEGKGEEWWRG